MRIVYKRSLTFISILLVIVLLIGFFSLFYKRSISPSTPVIVDNELSINYMDGYKIYENKEYHFSITNNSTQDVYYDIRIVNLAGYESQVQYSLTSDTYNSKEMQAIDKNNLVLESSVLIPAKETQNYTLTIANNSITSFELNVKRTTNIEEYFYATILKNNSVKEKSVTTLGQDIATINEGLIKDTDDYGTAYYFRGNVSNNYVDFAGLTWRIVRINGDGSVKIVLNTLTEALTTYHSEKENFENLEESSIYNSLKEYYDLYLKNYDEKIANTKYCNENGKIENTYEFLYNAYTRIYTNKIPTLNCLGDKFMNKIGLMSVDEIIYAGASLEEDNKEFYLYQESIETNWWTSSLAKATDSDYFPFIVSTNGKVLMNVSGTYNRGLRPVINLAKDVQVTGDGTINNMYTVVE